MCSSAVTDELTRLVSVGNCTAALAFGWERIRRTMPEAKLPRVLHPDMPGAGTVSEEKVARFLGLIEGRLRVAPPREWEAALKSARWYGRNAYFFSSSDERDVRSGWQVRRDGEHWVLRQDGDSIRVSAKNTKGVLNAAVVEFDKNTEFVALYHSAPVGYMLFALERGSGTEIWHSEVWAFSNLRPLQGRQNHRIEMRFTEETVVVFGTSYGFGFSYLEAFDRKTGKNLGRFNTLYFDRSFN
jgi:hypothetical protein